MGVWDLRELHNQIKRYEKLAKTEGLSDADRDFYLGRMEGAKVAYKRELKNWENRVGRNGEDDNGKRSE